MDGKQIMLRLSGTNALKIVLGAGAVAFLASLAPSPAEAGQPWSCTCNGKTKRFIASTKACEKAQPKNSNIKRMSKMIACTRTEFVAWNQNACAQKSCTLVGAKSKY
jgi:hypothetical protein